MEFQIIIKNNKRTIRLTVVCLPIDERSERYKVIARNKTLTLETNWPIFLSRGLKYRRPDWKLVDGTITYAPVYQAIIEAIEAHVRDEMKKGRRVIPGPSPEG